MADEFSDEPPTDPVGDPKKTTQRSEPSVTQKRAAFQDDTSPESLLLAEINKHLGAALGETNKQLGILNASINTVRTELTEDIKGLRTRGDENTNKTLSAYSALTRHLIHVRTMTDELWRSAFHDRPPPPPPSKDEELSFALSQSDPDVLAAAKTGRHHRWTSAESDPKVHEQLDADPKVREQLDSHEGTLAALHGQALRMDGRQERLEEDVQKALHIAQETLNLQKEQMGKKDPEAPHRTYRHRIADAFLWAWREREGQKFVFQLIAALTGLLWAFNYFYAMITGHPLTSLRPPQASTFEPAPDLATPPSLPPHVIDPAAR